ncbi:hypothetical protein [Rhodococcoides fascians]|uniref:hypothetical protein n=1 Tax=Rhodococcoides fascians TaxID=1828 RepID=UPI00055DA3CE|nr:hypothetical protein [Rhodococcus fascians]
MTVDNALRRNRIAGITASHYREEIARTTRDIHTAYPGRPVHIRADLAIAALNNVIAALAGETNVHKLGIDPCSVPAMALAAYTTPAKHEPEGNTL